MSTHVGYLMPVSLFIFIFYKQLFLFNNNHLFAHSYMISSIPTPYQYSIPNYLVSSNYLIIIICLHTVIWFQVFLPLTNIRYPIIWFQVTI